MNKTNIKGKQIGSYQISANHLNISAKQNVLEEKKTGQANIINQYTINDYSLKTEISTEAIDITKKIFDNGFETSYDYQGIKRGTFTTGTTITEFTGDVFHKIIGTGFDNYKIWLRDFATKVSYVESTNKRKIFGELFAYEYKNQIINTSQLETITINAGDNFGIIDYHNGFDNDNYTNKIICSWNGQNEISDFSFGYIDHVSTDNVGPNKKKIILSEPAERNYEGYYKTLSYYLKLYTTDPTNNAIIEYTPSIGKIIDIMFVETITGFEEYPNNTYKYINFYEENDNIDNANPTFQNVDISGNLTVLGNTNLKDIDVQNAIVEQDLSVLGNTNLKDIDVQNAIVEQDLSVLGNTTTKNVTITGNLIVNGTTTNQNVNNLVIKDNIITLNNGETGNGVTANISGLEIDRGTLPKYQIIFNETTDQFEVGEEGNTAPIQTAIVFEKDEFLNVANDDETFTLNFSVKSNSESVFLNGLLQSKTLYTISGTNLSFNSGIQVSGDDVIINYVKA